METETDLDSLSSRELHDLAVRRALHHADVGFFWELLRAIPAAETLEGDVREAGEDLTKVSALLSDALTLARATSRTSCGRSTSTTCASTRRSSRHDGLTPRQATGNERARRCPAGNAALAAACDAGRRGRAGACYGT